MCSATNTLHSQRHKEIDVKTYVKTDHANNSGRQLEWLSYYKRKQALVKSY